MRSRVTFVSIKERQVGERVFDSIRVDVGGLPMYCDLMHGDGGMRQIRAAKRIADDNQAFFMYDDKNAERCREAIGISEDAAATSCGVCGSEIRQRCMDPRCPQSDFMDFQQ